VLDRLDKRFGEGRNIKGACDWCLGKTSDRCSLSLVAVFICSDIGRRACAQVR
jgi:hypothetical protein